MKIKGLAVGSFGFVAALTVASSVSAQQLERADLRSVTTLPKQAKAADQSAGMMDADTARYVIQRQDTLIISFPFSPELNETVTVQPDGFISLMSAKSLYAQGMTVPELIESIKKSYDGILASPAVTVDIKDFQHPYFTVIGEVNKPGKYDIREKLTVAQALSVAGGIEPTAKTQLFLLHRDVDAWRVEKLDLRDVLNGKKTSDDRVLKTGDMIVVPEKFIVSFKKYVPYSFNLGSYFQLASIP